MENTEAQRKHLEQRIAMFKADLAKNPARKAELTAKIKADEKTLRLLPFGN